MTLSQPREGSTAYLALQQLCAHGRMHRDALAQALDKPGDEIRALLGYAIRMGLITCVVDDSGSWFDVGDGKPLAPPTPPAAAAPAAAPAPPAPVAAPAPRVAAVAAKVTGGAPAWRPNPLPTMPPPAPAPREPDIPQFLPKSVAKQVAAARGRGVDTKANDDQVEALEAALAPSPAPNQDSSTATVSAAYGSQNSDGEGNGIAPAKAGSVTHPKGANRGVPTGQSHGAGSLQEGQGRGTNGAPVPAAAPASIPVRRDSQHVLKAEAARPDATDRETPANASPVGGPMGVGQPAAAGPSETPATTVLRCALWNDGELYLQRSNGDDVALSVDETRALVRYLDSIALDLVREEAA